LIAPDEPAVPISEAEILSWIADLHREDAEGPVNSGDTLVIRSPVKNEYEVYRLTQTYRVEDKD
jgi:hypothetical protein